MRIIRLKTTIMSWGDSNAVFSPVRLVHCNLVGKGVRPYIAIYYVLGLMPVYRKGYNFLYGEVSLDETHIQNLALLGLSLLYLSGEL